MRPSETFAVQRDWILAIARAHGATNLRVFGSALRGSDRPDSDLDLLVDVPLGTSLLSIVDIKLAIKDALGVPVELCTESKLHPVLKDRILAEASPL